MKIRVIRARASDLAAVLELLEHAHLPAADLSRARMPGFLLAVDGDEVVGCVGIEALGDGQGLLRSLAVAGHARGRGVGNALLRAALQRAPGFGARSLWLLTEEAAEFFLARGFRAAKRDEAPPAVLKHAQFAALCPQTAVCLHWDGS
jgi:amino-acid N-acetyltransferase